MKRMIGVLFVLVMVLSACSIKANIGIKVNPNGSGTIATTIGMDQGIEQLLMAGNSDTSALDCAGTVKKWSDSGYDWTQCTVKFNTLDDLTQRATTQNGLFSQFRIIKQSNFFVDQYVLDAQASMPADTSGYDVSSMFQVQVSVTLPGKIADTNGTIDSKNPNTSTWDIGNQPVTFHLVTDAINWFNVGVLIGMLLGLILAVVLLVVGIKAAIKK